MANFYDFSSSDINVFSLLIDNSGSMDDEEDNVRKGIKLYRKSFKNFPEANSISVSVSKFNSDFYPQDFKKISEISTDYDTGGYTALYYSIVKGAQHLKNYINKIVEKKKTAPTATFVVFSDGASYHDMMTEEDARKVINELNFAGITTVFIAFGDAISSEFGKRLGFRSTIDIDSEDALINFFGINLSEACKEQSKSYKALGSNFFSQAVNSENSQNYSQTTEQALDDDSWINAI